MKVFPIAKILGVLLILFSSSMLPPIAVSLLSEDGVASIFVWAFLTVFLIGLLSWYPARSTKHELRFADGFLVVVLFWVVLGVMSSIPLILLETPVISLADAVFESLSGLTTTGATVLINIDTLPPSVLYYRQ